MNHNEAKRATAASTPADHKRPNPDGGATKQLMAAAVSIFRPACSVEPCPQATKVTSIRSRFIFFHRRHCSARGVLTLSLRSPKETLGVMSFYPRLTNERRDWRRRVPHLRKPSILNFFFHCSSAGRRVTCCTVITISHMLDN